MTEYGTPGDANCADRRRGKPELDEDNGHSRHGCGHDGMNNNADGAMVCVGSELVDMGDLDNRKEGEQREAKDDQNHAGARHRVLQNPFWLQHSQVD